MALVLAFGRGRGLMPLTADRASSAVPFAGTYRLIDFALSNLVNGGVRKIAVLTQYKSHSLNRHIAQAWQLSPLVGDGIMTVPAQMRVGPRWFMGSADAIYQNLHVLRQANPDHVCVVPSEHVYRIDPRPVLAQHRASGARATVVAVRAPVERASRMAVLDLDRHGRARALRAGPAGPRPRPGAWPPTDPSRHVWAWTGMCVFDTRALQDAITRDALSPWSRHDLGESVLGPMAERGEVAVHDLAANEVPGATDRDRGYWHEVGDLEAYFHASMDLVASKPEFNLYNRAWPIYGWQPQPLPPATFTFDGVGAGGQAVESLVSPGVIVAGGTVRRSILSPDVVVREAALVEDCILMNGVEVGRGAVLSRAIVDKDVVIPPGFHLGGDGDSDHQRFHVSSSGIVAVGKRQSLEHEPAAVPSSTAAGVA